MKRARAPFVLPETPVDGYEVGYFALEGQGEHLRVVHVGCIYRAKVTWAEVYPDRAKENGLDFDDQWQLLVDGESGGREDGWATPRASWEDCFATREEAVGDAQKRLALALVALRATFCAQERALEARLADFVEGCDAVAPDVVVIDSMRKLEGQET